METPENTPAFKAAIPQNKKGPTPMKVENGVRIFAGTLILVSVALVYFVSPWWLLFTAFIGIQLIQSAFTGFCPPAYFLRKLGCQDSGTCCGNDVK